MRYMMKTKIAYALLPLLMPFSSKAQEGNRMNVLLITADDLNHSSVGFNGCLTPEISPHLDRLASESYVFTGAHVNIAVSQPSRACLHTGRYSHNNGVEGFTHTDLKIPTLMSELRNAGYFVGIAGKVGHSTPHTDFKWDIAYDQKQVGQGRDPERYAEVFREVIHSAKEAGKPFYFCANSHDPHRPFHGSKQESKLKAEGVAYPAPSRVFTKEEVQVPSFLPDIEGVREELAQYYSSVRRMDDTVGAILSVLKDENMEDNTLIVFLSDNGMSIPFAKTNCYDNSTRTPLMFRIPGHQSLGTRDSLHLVSEIDYMPTVLEICGLNVPDGLDGKSLVGILNGNHEPERDVVFSQFYETSGKRRYPMFKVQTKDYMYIFNPWSDGEYKFLNDCQGGSSFRSMVEMSKSDNGIKSRVDLFWYRIREELYDMKTDADALENLAYKKEFKDILEKMRGLLTGWMEEQNLSATECMKRPYSERLRKKYMEYQHSLVKIKDK